MIRALVEKLGGPFGRKHPADVIRATPGGALRVELMAFGERGLRVNWPRLPAGNAPWPVSTPLHTKLTSKGPRPCGACALRNLAAAVHSPFTASGASCRGA
jgi:hypothetical protein